MTPAEQLFDGAPVAHVVAFYERQRLQRIADQGREALARRPILRTRWAA